MSENTQTESRAKHKQTTTLYYGKFFALLGVLCGCAMLGGTPAIVTLYHESTSSYGREWVESLPSWTIPTMLCIGMGGGVLTIVLSALFGILIPSRVVREVTADDSEEKAAVQ